MATHHHATPNPLHAAQALRIRAVSAHLKACAHEQADAALQSFAAHCTPAQRARIADIRRTLTTFALEASHG